MSKRSTPTDLHAHLPILHVRPAEVSRRFSLHAPLMLGSSATEFQEYDYTRSGNPTRSALEKL
eukprot:754246-Hanusia_phi.AAC.1